jgi:hypothetical protein
MLAPRPDGPEGLAVGALRVRIGHVNKNEVDDDEVSVELLPFGPAGFCSDRLGS